MQNMDGHLIYKTELLADIIAKNLCQKTCKDCRLIHEPIYSYRYCHLRIPIRKAASAIWRSLTIDQDRVMKIFTKKWWRSIESVNLSYRDEAIKAMVCDMPILIKESKNENK